MMYYRTLLVIFFGFTIVGCESIDEIPEDKAKYVGLWKGDNAAIEIRDDGFVSYAKIVDGISETIDGPIKRFEGDDFIVGFLFFTKKFEVKKPPFIDGNVYKMVIEDMEFVRQDDW